MNHKKVANADLHELASLYALGALDADEKMAFEEHVRQGCDTCSQEVRSFTGIVQLLGESVPVEPPRQMREQLLSRTSGRTQVPGILFEESGLLIALSDELAWQTFAPGIVYKALYQDAARKYNTSLVRMDAGARYPSHQHAAVEEIFLISGDLHVEDQVMYAGDYCRADPGSIHGETLSETGCLFLLMTSPGNRVVENRAV